MSSRRLSDEERALWARVEQSAKPIRARSTRIDSTEPVVPAPKPRKAVKSAPGRRPQPAKMPVPNSAGLDSSWNRKLFRGDVDPDFTIDLHGLSLDQAWSRLNRTLSVAVERQSRIVLVITGKDRGPDVRTDSSARGRIRAKLADWVSASPSSSRVIAIKPASRRHGGDGAVYLVLKRDKGNNNPAS